ncbi:hypothetical protein O181_020398 [Austropuccinia psidii MF-1]|uniref:Uncharacterized protein n=1 Tax=Austropuccinia psidii MF-1 TaxID=1389203 RepID=A0A9Q3GUH0_9BASI|nr:hypothetical protein [Austropuccinia psidii MF-1]
MSSKLTELTESSPSVLPQSVICGSGILSQLDSSGHFDPAQTYAGYKEVEVLDPACIKCLAKGKDFFQHDNLRSLKCHFCFVGKKPCHCTGVLASNVRGYLWSKKDGPFGKEFPASEATTHDGTLGYSNLTHSWQRDVARLTNVGGPIPVGGRPIYSSSEVPISRINTEIVVKQIRQIANSPSDPDAEACDELDGEEVKVVHNYSGHKSSTSPSHPPAKRFQSHIIPSTPRTFQPILFTIPTSLPPASQSFSPTRPAFIPELQPVASSSRRREELSPFPFPGTQVFQQRGCWLIRVTRENPNMASDNQDAVAMLFKRVDRNSREVIEYANDRTITGTSSEEMAGKFAWYED